MMRPQMPVAFPRSSSYPPAPPFHWRTCAQALDVFDDMPPLVELSDSEDEAPTSWMHGCRFSFPCIARSTSCRRCQGLTLAGACMHVRGWWCEFSVLLMPCRRSPKQRRQCWCVPRVREVPPGATGANSKARNEHERVRRSFVPGRVEQKIEIVEIVSVKVVLDRIRR